MMTVAAALANLVAEPTQKNVSALATAWAQLKEEAAMPTPLDNAWIIKETARLRPTIGAVRASSFFLHAYQVAGKSLHDCSAAEMIEHIMSLSPDARAEYMAALKPT